MAEESKIENIVSEQKTRRSAIRTAAQVAVTAPAVGLLLSAGTKAAQAYIRVGSFDNASPPGSYTTADDFFTTATGFGSDDATFIGDDLYTF